MARIIIIISILAISGCTIPTKVEQVQVPVLICPMPPDIERPNLEMYKLTDEDKNDPGKIAQAIKITLIQLQAYSVMLETVLQTYENTSKEYEALRHELDIRFPDIQK